MAADLRTPVAENGLLAPGRGVVIMLSGGADSTCLLDLAARVCGPEHVLALHVNYGLREGAEADERHCRSLCELLGVELEVRRPHRGTSTGTGTGRGPGRGNLQAWARAARYDAARSLAADRGADVAAGHTATDQVETILYRLASSPSRRALLGMRARDGVLVRPLLPYTRTQTVAHCRARSLGWREDPSNATDVFARNRIRHQLVPALESAHPAAQANVLALAEILRDEAAVIDAAVDATLAGRAEIPLATLRELAPALRRLVVQRLADAAIGGPAAGVARRAGEVAALRETGTASVDLPHGVRATARNGVLRFDRTPLLD